MKSLAELRESICTIIFCVLMGATYLGVIATICYFIYTYSRTIDAYLHNAPTNCTILDPATYGSSKSGIYVNYTIPENINYTMQYLQNTDDTKSYYIGHIIPCFYALHDHTYIMAEKDFDIHHAVTALILVCIGAVLPTILLILLVLGAVIVIGELLKKGLQKVIGTIDELVTKSISRVRGTHVFPAETDIPKSKNSTRDSSNCYSLMSIARWKMGIRAITLWLKAKFTQRKSNESQDGNFCNAQEIGADKTKAGSDYSFESIEMLPPYLEHPSSGDH